MAGGTRGGVRPNLAQHGAELHAGLATGILPEFERLFESLPRSAGLRLTDLAETARFLSADGSIGSVATKYIGAKARPVRAIAFDKSAEANWALGWHQDRTICVRDRKEVDGFGPWTIKQGLHHVQPPFALLEGMVTLRIHLDPVNTTNAPLKVALGSHLLGRIEEPEIAAMVGECDVFRCLAKTGDVWVYSTPVIHASDRSTSGLRRRVLQIDYCAETLPANLEWLL